MNQLLEAGQQAGRSVTGQINPDARRRAVLAGIGALSVLGLGALTSHVLPSLSRERAPTAGRARIAHQLGWLNGVQFGGDYVAIERGYFAREGLDVQYTAGGPGTDYRMLVASGRATVSESNPAGMISGHLRNQPLVAFAAVMQRDPSCFVSPGDHPVTSLQDMIGKTIGVPNSIRGQIEALLRRAKIAPDHVKLVPVGNDPTLLAARQVDAYYGWETTAVPPLRRAKLDPHVLRFSDLGFRGYGQVLMTRRDILDDHHDELVRYTRALVQGWSWMVRHPRETAELVVAHYAPPGTLLDEQIEEAGMMMSYLSSGDTHEHGMLWIDPGVFEDSVALGREAGTIPAGTIVDVSKFVTQSVIREALDQP